MGLFAKLAAAFPEAAGYEEDLATVSNGRRNVGWGLATCPDPKLRDLTIDSLLHGGADNDTPVGGHGNDLLFGGAGRHSPAHGLAALEDDFVDILGLVQLEAPLQA